MTEYVIFNFLAFLTNFLTKTMAKNRPIVLLQDRFSRTQDLLVFFTICLEDSWTELKICKLAYIFSNVSCSSFGKICE